MKGVEKEIPFEIWIAHEPSRPRPNTEVDVVDVPWEFNMKTNTKG